MLINHPLLGPRDAAEFTCFGDASLLLRPDPGPNGEPDQAAMDAVLKFKYKPRVIDGEAVEVDGVRNRMTFEMN